MKVVLMNACNFATAAILTLMLTACGPEPKAPATAKVSQPQAEIHLGNWGPQSTQVGVGANVQPNGGSAIWIEATGVTQDSNTHVTFGGIAGSGTVVSDKLVTVLIPKDVISKVGSYDVVIEEPSGRKTRVGAFIVSEKTK